MNFEYAIRADTSTDASNRCDYFDRMCSNLSDSAELGYEHGEHYRTAGEVITQINSAPRHHARLRQHFEAIIQDASILENIAERGIKRINQSERPHQMRQFLEDVRTQQPLQNQNAIHRLNSLVSWVCRDNNVQWQGTDVLLRAFRHLATDARCQMDVYRAANYYNRAEALKRLEKIRQDAKDSMLTEFGVLHDIVRLSVLCELTQFYGERVATYYDEVTEPTAETSGNPAVQDDTVSEMLHSTLQNIFRALRTRDIELNCLFESVSIGMFPSRSSALTIELRTKTVLLLISEWHLFCEFEEFHGDLLGYISCVLRAAHRYTPVSAAVLRALAHVTRRNIYIFYLPYQSPYASQIARPSTIDVHANADMQNRNLYVAQYPTNASVPYSHACALILRRSCSLPEQLLSTAQVHLARYEDIGVKVDRSDQIQQEPNQTAASTSQARSAQRDPEEALSDDQAPSSCCCLPRKSRRAKSAKPNASVQDSQLSDIRPPNESTFVATGNSVAAVSTITSLPFSHSIPQSLCRTVPVARSQSINRTDSRQSSSGAGAGASAMFRRGYSQLNEQTTLRLSTDHLSRVTSTEPRQLPEANTLGAFSHLRHSESRSVRNSDESEDDRPVSSRSPGTSRPHSQASFQRQMAFDDREQSLEDAAQANLTRSRASSVTSLHTVVAETVRSVRYRRNASIAVNSRQIRNANASPTAAAAIVPNFTIGGTISSADTGFLSTESATQTSNADTSPTDWRSYKASFEALPRFSLQQYGPLQRTVQQPRRKQDNMTIYGNRTDLMLAKYDALVELLGRRERSDEFYTVVVRRVSNHVMYELLRLRLRPNAATSSATARETESETSETIAAYEETKAALQAAMAATFTERPRLFKDVWKRLNDLQTKRCRRCRRLLKQSDTANIRSEFAELNKLEELFEQLEQELVKWITEKWNVRTTASLLGQSDRQTY